MKEIIYLVVSRAKVERMTKNLPLVGRGEIPVKLEVIVAPSAFREPVLTRRVEIDDWREDIDIEDVEFRGHFITPEEAELIKSRRLEKMAAILQSQGYVVARPGEEAATGEEPV